MNATLAAAESFFCLDAVTPLQVLDIPEARKQGVRLQIKRDDMTHPIVSGNKYRKLKYNVFSALQQNFGTLLSFGGSFSNHIHALSAVGKILGINTIGIIRGEESYAENPTLSFAAGQGMRLCFVNREEYRQKETEQFVTKLRDRFGEFYIIPEGGSNEYALRGCQELAEEIYSQCSETNYICAACGTGATIAGMSVAAAELERGSVIGFPVLKAEGFFEREISAYLAPNVNKSWQLVSDYHFGGYAKLNRDLLSFKSDFETRTAVPLDPIYTAKMVYGVFDLLNKGFFPRGSVVTMLHSGGLQGNAGLDTVLKRNRVES
ncbi:MAG: pyridoxal-phosphate dependent enzyme [Gammaproteobacteria bacterium]|nr:pyridoxal-phosphate dependent enzyme [Gammaproteobacteria bacterium]